MALTWANARAKVRGDLWRPQSSGLPDDQVDRALHASLLDLESKRDWLWLQNINSTLAMPSDDQKLAEPTDLRTVQSLAFLDTGLGTTYDVLELSPIATVRAAARGTSNGLPQQYCRASGYFYLDSQVATGKKFELIYESRTPSDLDAAIAAGSNTTLSLHQQAVIAKACAVLSLTFLKNEAEAARQQTAYDDMVNRLIDEEDAARGDDYGGSVQPDTSYRDAAFGNGGCGG